MITNGSNRIHSTSQRRIIMDIHTSNDLQQICESDADPPLAFVNSLFLKVRKDLDPIFFFLLDWSLIKNKDFNQ